MAIAKLKGKLKLLVIELAEFMVVAIHIVAFTNLENDEEFIIIEEPMV